MYARPMTSERTDGRAGKWYPAGADMMPTMLDSQPAVQTVLDFLAESAAALAAATDVTAVASVLARRLAEAGGAASVKVWLAMPDRPECFAFAAAWPSRGSTQGPPDPLDLAAEPLACQAFEHGGPLSVGFTSRRPGATRHGDALTWVVPLIAGDRRIGLAYVAGGRSGEYDRSTTSVLATVAT